MVRIYKIRGADGRWSTTSLGRDRDDAIQYAYDHLLTDPQRRRLRARDLQFISREHDFDDFNRRFLPLRNPFDRFAPLDGVLLETFGMEYDFVTTQRRTFVWTLVEGDSFSWITAGLHQINRIGYVVSAESWNDPNERYVLY